MLDGRYAVPYAPDKYRLFWFKTIIGNLGYKKDAALMGKQVLYYKTAKGWQSFAFVDEDNSIHIYQRFLLTWTPGQLEAIRQAVLVIVQDPDRARKLYENTKGGKHEETPASRSGHKP